MKGLAPSNFEDHPLENELGVWMPKTLGSGNSPAYCFDTRSHVTTSIRWVPKSLPKFKSKRISANLSPLLDSLILEDLNSENH